MSDEAQMEATAVEDSGGVDSSEGGGDEYWEFGDRLDGEIVNNDGSPIGGEETPDGENEEATEEETKPEKTTPSGSKAKAAAATAPIPQGYIGGYFRDADDGGKEFDVDTFTKEVVGDPRTAWKYGERKYAEASQAKAQDEDPVESYYRQEKEYRGTFRSNFLAYRTALDKYLQMPNMTLQQADSLAMRDVEQMISQHFEERDIRRRSQERKELLEQQSTGSRSEEMKAKSRSNINTLINEHGGVERFGQFMQDGYEYINALFDIANPDFSGTKEETAKAINDWFERSIASDMGKLRMLQRVIKGQIAMNAIPWMYKRGRSDAQQLTKQNAKTQSRKMGGRTGGAPKTEARDSLDAYFDPTIDRGGIVDTVG